MRNSVITVPSPFPAGYQCCRCLCQLVGPFLPKGEIVVWGTSGTTEVLRLLPLGKQVLHILMNDPWSIDSGIAKQLTNKQKIILHDKLSIAKLFNPVHLKLTHVYGYGSVADFSILKICSSRPLS